MTPQQGIDLRNKLAELEQRIAALEAKADPITTVIGRVQDAKKVKLVGPDLGSVRGDTVEFLV